MANFFSCRGKTGNKTVVHSVVGVEVLTEMLLAGIELLISVQCKTTRKPL